MGEGKVIVHVDYGDSHKNNQKDEIQSAYLGHESFSIFTVSCYTIDKEWKIAKHSATVIGKSSDHSRIAALTCVNMAVNEM